MKLGGATPPAPQGSHLEAESGWCWPREEVERGKARSREWVSGEQGGGPTHEEEGFMEGVAGGAVDHSVQWGANGVDSILN